VKRSGVSVIIALLALAICQRLAAAAGDEILTPRFVGGLGISSQAGKIVLVLGSDKSSTVKLYAFERTKNGWAERIRTDGFAGRNGIDRIKREGDGKTPSGVYSFGRAFGTADDPGAATPYTRLSDGDLWVDDPQSESYNKWVKNGEVDKDWASAEDLSKETSAYKYAIAINYNTAPIVKGAGSAIFLHCAAGRPTAGCIAVPEKSMMELLGFIDSGTLIAIAGSLRELAAF
jgi:L,D-peptidoglycan transpeptidase YkuD (ErfK/YbiS/YcfS/YnhG family)